MKTIIITDNPDFWLNILQNKMPIEFKTPLEYLTTSNDVRKTNRVINLSPSYDYQAVGYYVSLLGQARGDKIIPSVLTIQDFNTKTSKHLVKMQLKNEIQKTLKPLTSETFELSVYFGKNLAKHYEDLCQKLHSIIPMPLFRVFFKKSAQGIWNVRKISALNPVDINSSHHNFLAKAAQTYFERKRVVSFKQKKIACSVAMLTDPTEKSAPSNAGALEKFIKVGEKHGVDVVPIHKDDMKSLAEYDGLFIRATTAVNNYTYQFSRRAVAEGLVVIDDPTSILRCANKVYLADLLKNNHVQTPETTILVKNNWQNQLKNLNFPLIIKLPDSAFSLGVVKVNDRKGCIKTLNDYFKRSELLIVQQYMPSKFDWRIGILDQEPLYACRYYMAKDHWQIYNWESTDEYEGEFDTVPLSEVPPAVLQAAVKAAKPIGNGLYGVDIKYIDDTAYVIEVNDNPNVDRGVEDQILGDELYAKIIGVFLNRIRRKFHGG